MELFWPRGKRFERRGEILTIEQLLVPTPHQGDQLLVGSLTAYGQRGGGIFSSLGPQDVERMILEDHSFVEQAGLFRGAEAVIGCHGAGFANLVFCSEGTAA